MGRASQGWAARWPGLKPCWRDDQTMDRPSSANAAIVQEKDAAPRCSSSMPPSTPPATARLEHGHQHGLGYVGLVARPIRERGLQQGRRTAKGQPHSVMPSCTAHGDEQEKPKHQRGCGEYGQAQQRQRAQQAIHQQAGEPDPHDGRDAKQQQHGIDPFPRPTDARKGAM